MAAAASNGVVPARKVMVVAEPTRESTGALQYALCHAVIEKDELILLHIENPSSWRNAISTFLRRPSLGSSTTTSIEVGGGGEVDFLEDMKRSCKAAQPKVSVRVVKVEMESKDKGTAMILSPSKDKASIILSQAKALGVDVVIIGQRRSFSTALLGNKRPGGPMKGTRLMIDTAEYLIENSPCTCVGVQKKGQNGGFVLNSKTHKNFWVLA